MIIIKIGIVIKNRKLTENVSFSKDKKRNPTTNNPHRNRAPTNHFKHLNLVQNEGASSLEALHNHEHLQLHANAFRNLPSRLLRR